LTAAVYANLDADIYTNTNIAAYVALRGPPHPYPPYPYTGKSGRSLLSQILGKL